ASPANPATRRSAPWPTTRACPAWTPTASTEPPCGGGPAPTGRSRPTRRSEVLGWPELSARVRAAFHGRDARPHITKPRGIDVRKRDPPRGGPGGGGGGGFGAPGGSPPHPPCGPLLPAGEEGTVTTSAQRGRGCIGVKWSPSPLRGEGWGEGA